jgi:hypothetical protein
MTAVARKGRKEEAISKVVFLGPKGAAFDTWQAAFNTYLQANVVALGLTASDPDVVAMGTTQANWNSGYTAHNNAQNAAQAAPHGTIST